MVRLSRCKGQIGDETFDAQGGNFKSGTRKTSNDCPWKKFKKLKKECGWSYDKLGIMTDTDPSLVKGHVKGKGYTPRKLKAYADAFSKELGRTISPTDLESDDLK